MNPTKTRLAQLRRRPSVLKDILEERILRNKYRHEIEHFVAHVKSLSLEDRSSGQLKLNKLCCVEDWENNELIQILSELDKIGTVGWPHRHRKDWEWAMGIIAMCRIGKLNKDSTALGVGSGKETVLFYLANNIKHLFATDLYAGDAWTEAPADFPDNPKKYCASNFNQNALTILRMNGTKLEFPSSNFDIVFSFSSIEHFGGRRHSGALRALKEMERVLKPGGIAIVSTEFILNGKDHEEFFNAKTIYSDLLDPLANLQLVEPLDLTISQKTLNTILDYYMMALNWQKLCDEDKEAYPHILLRKKAVLWTSVMMVLEKKK